uniref:Uncharacterized protein n=1 Tax=Astyanax mexicanus TaxID=7994 RepID=A0A3B1KKR4_ASTMX
GAMSRAEGIFLTMWVLLLLIISTAPLVDASSEKSGDQSEEKRELVGRRAIRNELIVFIYVLLCHSVVAINYLCNIGDFCTVKKGSRFGQLCDCPRESKCNLFFLKCL